MGQLTVLADFDRTLTSFRLPNGKVGTSSHGLVERSGLLSEEFHKLTHALYEKYYPLEISHSLSHDEKVLKMEEWWSQAHDLLIKEHVTREKITKMVAVSEDLHFRDGCADLLRLCDDHGAPVLVFSAGLGDLVVEALKQHLPDAPFPHVVSNFMEFDEATGVITGFRGPNIHALNKGEFDTKSHSEFADAVEGKTHALLLGDNCGDVHMSVSLKLPEANVLNVGFLNDNVDARIDEYTSKFDLVLLDDGDMTPVLDLLRDIQAAHAKTS